MGGVGVPPNIFIAGQGQGQKGPVDSMIDIFNVVGRQHAIQAQQADTVEQAKGREMRAAGLLLQSAQPGSAAHASALGKLVEMSGGDPSKINIPGEQAGKLALNTIKEITKLHQDAAAGKMTAQAAHDAIVEKMVGFNVATGAYTVAPPGADVLEKNLTPQFQMDVNNNSAENAASQTRLSDRLQRERMTMAEGIHGRETANEDSVYRARLQFSDDLQRSRMEFRQDLTGGKGGESEGARAKAVWTAAFGQSIKARDRQAKKADKPQMDAAGNLIENTGPEMSPAQIATEAAQQADAALKSYLPDQPDVVAKAWAAAKKAIDGGTTAEAATMLGLAQSGATNELAALIAPKDGEDRVTAGLYSLGQISQLVDDGQLKMDHNQVRDLFKGAGYTDAEILQMIAAASGK